MRTSLTREDINKVIILGGTGAQGLSVVKALSATNNYEISVLTRDVGSAKALEIQSRYRVNLIPGSYSTESGLRDAFNGQDVCYFTIDSFSIGEPYEYFWTFRAYEIAIQAGLKWFIYSGSPDRYRYHGYQEQYRSSHNVVASRLSGWLASQHVEQLPWSIVTGGVYAEMLNSLLAPKKDQHGALFAAPVNDNSVIPLIPLEMYGVRVKWMLENPDLSVGRYLSAAPFLVTYPEIARAFQAINNIPTQFLQIPIETWMEKASAVVDVDKTMPRGSDKDDPTTFTFRRNFSAWWSIWRDSAEDADTALKATSWADSYYPTRPRSLEDWMRASASNSR